MRLNTIVYSLKEGIASIIRHPLAALATISTTTLMLGLMGSFIVFSENAKKFAADAGQQPPVIVWMEYNTAEESLAKVESTIGKDSRVLKFTIQTPEENLKLFKKELGDDADVLEDFSAEYMPYTFSVQLLTPDDAQNFKISIESLPGVRKVEYSEPVAEFFSRLRSGINYISMVAFVTLCGITLFIISNMVRIAILSKAEEIEIMKHVGATNAYIRVPFIVEGVITGIIGAFIASFVVLSLYEKVLESSISNSSGLPFLKLVSVGEIGFTVILINLAVAVIISVAGSMVSVRKHLKV